MSGKDTGRTSGTICPNIGSYSAPNRCSSGRRMSVTNRIWVGGQPPLRPGLQVTEREHEQTY
jgi:hypothetical protein